MAESQTSASGAQGPAVTGNVFLYKKPELLNKEEHAKLGLKRLENPYAFAEGANIVPINVIEFTEAGKHYPIIFSNNEPRTPLVVTSLKADENLFVHDGVWDDFAYIPAYLRRYPFVFANDQASDRMALVIDREAALIDEKGGDMPFFKDGELTENTQRALEFCRTYEEQRVATDAFVKLVSDYDLLKTKKIEMVVSDQGDKRDFGEYVGVDEQKLANLPEDAIMDLWRKNYLPFIYAQLTSQANWRTLFRRAARRQMANGKAS